MRCFGLPDRAQASMEMYFISTASADDMNAWIILLCQNEDMPICSILTIIPSSSQLVKSEETAIQSFHSSCCMIFGPVNQEHAAGSHIKQMNQMKCKHWCPTQQKSLSCFRLSTASASCILKHTRLQMFHYSCKCNMATGTKSFKRAILHLMHGYFVIAFQTWLKRLHRLTTSGSHMFLYTCSLKWWNLRLLKTMEQRVFVVFTNEKKWHWRKLSMSYLVLRYQLWIDISHGTIVSVCATLSHGSHIGNTDSGPVCNLSFLAYNFLSLSTKKIESDQWLNEL